MAESTKSEAITTKPRENPQRLNVMVRHSPFLLKQADIDAPDATTAKRIFLEQCRVKHEERAKRVSEQRGLDETTKANTRRAIEDAYRSGIKTEEAGALDWFIRPTAEVEAERKKISEQRSRTWGDPVAV